MANERLRASMRAVGLDCVAVAEAVGVDPKTVERWVHTERVPHREHRQATSRLLVKDEAYLWPALLDDPLIKAAGEAEVLRVYPSRGSVPLELWTSLITSAREELTLLSYAGLFLLDNNPDITELLVECAVAGVRVRVLLGDPDSPAITQRGQEEGIGEDMAGRVRLAQRYLAPALGTPGLEVRFHSTTLYNSTFAGVFPADNPRFVVAIMLDAPAGGANAVPLFHDIASYAGRKFDIPVSTTAAPVYDLYLNY